MIKTRISHDDFTPALKKLVARGADLSDPMRRIAGIMADEVEENFAQEGRPRWQGLAALTIKARTRRGHWPGQILQESGSLAASIQQQSNKKSAMVGSNKEYAAIHNFGGMAGRNLLTEIPQREYLSMSDEGYDQVTKTVADYLVLAL